jgi:DNA replication initiation complex subunit (GINS family)
MRDEGVVVQRVHRDVRMIWQQRMGKRIDQKQSAVTVVHLKQFAS